jgi:hypothetical protein
MGRSIREIKTKRDSSWETHRRKNRRATINSAKTESCIKMVKKEIANKCQHQFLSDRNFQPVSNEQIEFFQVHAQFILITHFNRKKIISASQSLQNLNDAIFVVLKQAF